MFLHVMFQSKHMSCQLSNFETLSGPSSRSRPVSWLIKRLTHGREGENIVQVGSAQWQLTAYPIGSSQCTMFYTSVHLTPREFWERYVVVIVDERNGDATETSLFLHLLNHCYFAA